MPTPTQSCSVWRVRVSNPDPNSNAQYSAWPVKTYGQCLALCELQSAQYEKLKRENTRLQAEVERLEKEVLRQKALRCAHCTHRAGTRCPYSSWIVICHAREQLHM